MTVFLATVIALGGIVALDGMLQLSNPGAEYLLLLVVACVAAPHTLNLGHNARISTLHPFMLAAIFLFGVSETILLAMVAMIYFWIISRPRLPLHKALFNLANFILAGWIAGHLFTLAGGRPGDVGSPASLVALLLAALAFFAVNTGLVAYAVGREQRLNPFRVWYEKYSWNASIHLAAVSLVILVGMLRQMLGPQALFLIIPFCIIIYQFYRLYFRRASREGHRT